MQKIVINTCYGGFGISLEAVQFMAARYHYRAGIVIADWENLSRKLDYYNKHKEWPNNISAFELMQLKNCLAHKVPVPFEGDVHEIQRNDPLLIQVVEELGKKAFGENAELKIVEIPDDIVWTINDYDGKECVEEAHRTWS